MINFFKSKKFKKDIVGIFDDWKVGKFKITKGPYSLWIANDYYGFNDEGDPFLMGFTREEKKLLWQEIRGLARRKIFKEFNLNKYI